MFGTNKVPQLIETIEVIIVAAICNRHGSYDTEISIETKGPTMIEVLSNWISGVFCKDRLCQ